MPQINHIVKCAECKKVSINKVVECKRCLKFFHPGYAKIHMAYNNKNELVQCNGKIVTIPGNEDLLDDDSEGIDGEMVEDESSKKQKRIDEDHMEENIDENDMGVKLDKILEWIMDYERKNEIKKHVEEASQASG